MKRALSTMLFAALATSAATAAADDQEQQPQQQTQQQQTQQTQQTQQQAPSSDTTATSTTTTTAAVAPPTSAPSTSGAADSPLAPQPALEPEPRDTVTLYQRYRPNRAYLYTGGAMFIGSYATTAAINAAENVDRTLFIPVVGPWLHIADRPDDASTTGTVLIVGSGVVQGVGALLTAASFFIPERVPAATIQAGNVKMNVTPTAYGRGSAGLAAVGTF